MALIKGEPYARTNGATEQFPRVERGMSARWSPLTQEEMREIEKFEELVGKVDHGIPVDDLFSTTPATRGGRPKAAPRARRKTLRAPVRRS